MFNELVELAKSAHPRPADDTAALVGRIALCDAAAEIFKPANRRMKALCAAVETRIYGHERLLQRDVLRLMPAWYLVCERSVSQAHEELAQSLSVTSKDGLKVRRPHKDTVLAAHAKLEERVDNFLNNSSQANRTAELSDVQPPQQRGRLLGLGSFVIPPAAIIIANQFGYWPSVPQLLVTGFAASGFCGAGFYSGYHNRVRELNEARFRVEAIKCLKEIACASRRSLNSKSHCASVPAVH